MTNIGGSSLLLGRNVLVEMGNNNVVFSGEPFQQCLNYEQGLMGGQFQLKH